MKLPKGKSRLDLVKDGLTGGLPKRGRFIVSITRLQEDPDNERKKFHNMDDMIESVRNHGIIEPITVTQNGDNYRILTGHRRFRAAKAVGLTEVEIIIREPDDQVTRRFKSLISNIQRENIGAVELAETLRGILDSGSVPTQRELARQIGKSEQWMSSTLRVLELPARLLEKLRNTPAIGYDIAQRIAQVSDSQLQGELVSAALAGESSRNIRSRVQSHREKRGERAARKSSKNDTLQFSERQNGCIASVKIKKQADAKETILRTLRLLMKNVLADDSF